MRLLDPWAAAAFGLAAIAVVLVLHALRLRRGFQRVSSTLLWSIARRDLEGNVPWQRIRPSVLLVLRLLAALLLALALARPVTGGVGGGRVIVLIDASASMSMPAGANGETRLDAARDAARDFVARTLRSAPGTEVAVGTLAARAELRTGFERVAPALTAAIGAVQATDETDDPADALRLAAALRGTADDAAAAPRVVLFSDRAAVDLPEGGGLVLVDVRDADATPPNVGVTALGVRRDGEDPARLTGLARVRRTANAPPRVLVEAEIGAETVLSRVVEFANASREAEIPFAGAAPGEAVVRVRLRIDDALSADDEAALVLAPRRAPRVLVVAPGGAPDAWLAAVLEDAGVEVETASDPEDGRVPTRDLTVFDRCAPTAWPPAPALVLGAVGPGLALRDDDPGTARRIATWRRTDPVLRHAVLGDVAFDGRAGIVETGAVEVLARDAAGRAVIVAVAERGVRHVVVGFAVGRSNWPADVSFPIVVRNLVDAATLGRLGREASAARAGSPFELLLDVRGRARIEGPRSRAIDGEPGGSVSVALDRAGVYELDGAGGSSRRAFAVLSVGETDPEVPAALAAGDVRLGATAAPRPVEIPAQRLLLLVAFAVLLAEWLGHALVSGR